MAGIVNLRHLTTTLRVAYTPGDGEAIWDTTLSALYLGDGSTAGGILVGPSGHGSTTAVAGAATLNTGSGVVTSETLSSATTYTLTLTNSRIVSTSTVIVNATDSAGTAVALTSVTPGSGSAVIAVAMTALTGTVKIAFAVFN